MKEPKIITVPFEWTWSDNRTEVVQEMNEMIRTDPQCENKVLRVEPKVGWDRHENPISGWIVVEKVED